MGVQGIRTYVTLANENQPVIGVFILFADVSGVFQIHVVEITDHPCANSRYIRRGNSVLYYFHALKELGGYKYYCNNE
jgi:hypothetical protein